MKCESAITKFLNLFIYLINVSSDVLPQFGEELCIQGMPERIELPCQHLQQRAQARTDITHSQAAHIDILKAMFLARYNKSYVTVFNSNKATCTTIHIIIIIIAKT